MKYLILLANTGKAPSQRFTGNSGKSYRFLWSDTHKALIFDGRELEGDEFIVAADIFTATHEQNMATPAPRRLPEETDAEGALSLPVLPQGAGRSEMLVFAQQIGTLEAELHAARATIAELRQQARFAPAVQPAELAAAIPAAPVAPQPAKTVLPAQFSGTFDPDEVQV